MAQVCPCRYRTGTSLTVQPGTQGPPSRFSPPTGDFLPLLGWFFPLHLTFSPHSLFFFSLAGNFFSIATHFFWQARPSPRSCKRCASLNYHHSNATAKPLEQVPFLNFFFWLLAFFQVPFFLWLTSPLHSTASAAITRLLCPLQHRPNHNHHHHSHPWCHATKASPIGECLTGSLSPSVLTRLPPCWHPFFCVLSWWIVGQGMFALQEINQMEWAMCSYLEWQLNVDPRCCASPLWVSATFFFHVLTSPDLFHHPSHHYQHTQSEETWHKTDGDDLKPATFWFQAPYLRLCVKSPLPLSQLDLQPLELHPSSLPVPLSAHIIPTSAWTPDLLTPVYPASSVLEFPSPIPPSPLPHSSSPKLQWYWQ